MIPEISITKSVSIPLLGLGTWELRGERCEKAVKMALEIGYRHFDTALLYENHEAIVKALRGFPREQLFFTSKFFMPEEPEVACDRTLKELKTDYLDLFLLHYPDRSGSLKQTLHHLARLVETGKIRAFGVSNFTSRHIQDMLNCGISPAVNQVEFHPYLNQKPLLDLCEKHEIHLISYRPLGKGALIKDPIFEKIGKKYGKTPAQVSLRWIVEKDIPVIPKASTRHHLEENFAIFDFALDQNDHEILDSLKIQHRFCESAWSDFNYV